VSGRKYVFPPNDQKLESLAWSADGVSLTMNGAETRCACGFKSGSGAKAPTGPTRTSRRGVGGVDEGRHLRGEAGLHRDRYTLTATLQFTGDEVRCALETNVGFGPPGSPRWSESANKPARESARSTVQP
jgi:hypothetical protein